VRFRKYVLRKRRSSRVCKVRRDVSIEVVGDEREGAAVVVAGFCHNGPLEEDPGSGQIPVTVEAPEGMLELVGSWLRFSCKHAS